jgi:hypothetical protein
MGSLDNVEMPALAPRQFSSNVTQNAANDFDFPPPVSISLFRYLSNTWGACLMSRSFVCDNIHIN